MKKIILIPDSFKGTMSSMRVCTIMEEAIRAHYPEAEIISVPVADGGEGSVEAFLSAVGGKRISIEVSGPYFNKMETCYGIIDDTTAVIEMACCAGLPLVGDHKDPGKTTTFGVGEMILDAVKRGCRRIIVGLGGSATNDGGVGAAAAVGVRFLDRSGNSFVPTGNCLSDIASIDMSGRSPALADIEIIAMCDVDNPLTGTSGAAAVFGPQKGADIRMVQFLDGQLRDLGELVKKDLSKDVATLPGAGAAGGMGAGMLAFFDATLTRGIEVVLDLVRFDDLLEGCDLVFTGEGSLDSQSLRGKVVIGVARRTKKRQIPLVAVVGDIGPSVESAYDEGVSAIFSINRIAKDFTQVIARAPEDLALTMDNLMRFLRRMGFCEQRHETRS